MLSLKNVFWASSLVIKLSPSLSLSLPLSPSLFVRQSRVHLHIYIYLYLEGFSSLAPPFDYVPHSDSHSFNNSVSLSTISSLLSSVLNTTLFLLSPFLSMLNIILNVLFLTLSIKDFMYSSKKADQPPWPGSTLVGHEWASRAPRAKRPFPWWSSDIYISGAAHEMCTTLRLDAAGGVLQRRIGSVVYPHVTASNRMGSVTPCYWPAA